MANEKRLIDAQALIAELRHKQERYLDSHSVYEDAVYIGLGKAIIEVNYAPTVDAVSRDVVDQIMWERDYSIAQLEEHGIPFGGIAPDVVKVVRCKDCKRYCKSAIGSDDCLLLCVDVKPDDYCSHGERKDNDRERKV